MKRQRILDEISEERDRQLEKWGEQHHPDGTGGGAESAAIVAECRAENDALDSAGKLTWCHILEEEVLEACAEHGKARLREELIQVAAVAVAWIEDLDGRAG